jgi:hypothetical protein
MIKKNSTYLAGSYHDWRDRVVASLPGHNFSDPKNHRQSAIAKLVEDDMTEAMLCRRLFVGFPKGKSLGTMTYAEIGASKTAGNYIIGVDENEVKEPTLKFIADAHFSSFEEGIAHLKNFPDIYEKNDNLDRSKKPLGEVHNVLILGQVPEQVTSSKEKTYFVDFQATDLNSLGSGIDLVVVNFERGIRPKEHILCMGAAYSADIPIILCEASPIIYPPLAGLARRIFSGSERFDILGDYLEGIKSNEIGSEAKVMYELFKKYQS